jgi:hypothetical protein
MWGRPPRPSSRAKRGAGQGRRSASLLKQILKGLPRIVGLQAGGRGCFLLPGHADFVERTIIPGIFLGHALLHRLHALEAASGIEIHALLAGMQLEAALGTKPRRRNRLQHRAALRAARNRPRAGHVHRLRPHAVVTPRRRHGRWLFSGLFLFARLFRAVPVLISMLTVFS